MTEKRFRTGKGIFEEGYPSESIIDNKTGKIYYKGYAHYDSSREMCKLLNKLIEENEQLKQDNQRLIKMLDNAANYVQREHREISLDDFVEWWNNIITKGLDD